MSETNHTLVNLDDISVSAPCRVDWKDMKGSNRVRTCASCKLHVYNISDMTRIEAEELLSDRLTGRICLKLFRRKDGTLLTKDCSLALRIVDRSRQKLRLAAAALLSFFNLSPVFAQQLAQLGSVDRYGYFTNPAPQLENPINNDIRLKLRKYKGEGADTRALTYYSRAVSLEQMHRTSDTGALKAYEQALQVIRPKDFDWDPKFVDMVAARYANLLTKNGELKKAAAIEKEFALSKEKIEKLIAEPVRAKQDDNELLDESGTKSQKPVTKAK